MEQAVQYYMQYGTVIKKLRRERNQHIIDALKQSPLVKKNKIGSCKKVKKIKFKNQLKDVDLNFQNYLLMIQQKALNSEINFINNLNRFKGQIVRKVNLTKNKAKRIKKKQIRKFKKVVSNGKKFIRTKIVGKANRFKKQVVRKVNLNKSKVKRFKKKQIRKFKKVVSNGKKFIRTKIVGKVNRFKKQVVRKVNLTQSKVKRFKKQQIRKFKKRLFSNKTNREQIQRGIDEKRRKIEKLKQYRNQLLMLNSYTVEPQRVSRSRGVLYIWTFALISLLAMFVLLFLNISN